MEDGLAEIAVNFTIADGDGTGRSSGTMYIATGADRMSFEQQTLPTHLGVTATFEWIPLGPCLLAREQELHLRVRLGLAFAADGSIIPGSTGAVNPSLTIAALAERSMERIIERDISSLARN
jgi:hypothetical protein